MTRRLPCGKALAINHRGGQRRVVPRCQAKNANGSQCANEAFDSEGSCYRKDHQKQVYGFVWGEAWEADDE